MIIKKGMRIKRAKEVVKALAAGKTLTQTYALTHPNATLRSANKNCWRLWTEEVMDELDKLLKESQTIQVTKENMVKLIQVVVKKGLQGEAKWADYLKALDMLSKLVPEFSISKHEIEMYSNLSDEDLDRELRTKLIKLGLN